jgi:Undecaprenyl-phosphate galactose phosphotransferase WbaP
MEAARSHQQRDKDLESVIAETVQLRDNLESMIIETERLRTGLRLASPFKQTVKRAFDVVVALLLVVVFAPIFLIVALIIARDGGAVFFVQQRVGRGGRIFRCLKFRTMVKDAATVLDRLLISDPEAREEWLSTRKLKSDPRVTRVGNLLRATSIDELPQLLNVVFGDMSLVGPRPVVPEELHELYKGGYSNYLRVRPGLTGLWQISGRSHTPCDQRVHLDTLYVHNWTLWGDMIILFRTIPVVVSRHGAY